MPLVVTAQRLIDVGEVAVLVVAEEPQPVEKTRVRSERRAGAVRQRRVRIAFEPAWCQRTSVVSKSLPLLPGRTEQKQARFGRLLPFLW